MSKRFLVSCLGLGWMPFAPGTWGSLPPAVIFAFFYSFEVPSTLVWFVMLAFVLVGSAACVGFSPASIAATGKKDPSEVVTDEFAGQALTFLWIFALGPVNPWVAAGAGFLLFRFFDILKPWPIRQLESLAAGWGILFDDLMAGIYAGICLLALQLSGILATVSSFLPLDSKGELGITFAVILGAIQGLTEFLPVSSSGHLVLFEHLFNFDPKTPAMLLFDLSVHVGTVLAILLVFRKSVAAFICKLADTESYKAGLMTVYKSNPAVHIAVLAVVSTFVTAAVALPFEKGFVAVRGNLLIVSAMWVLTGTLLVITDKRKKTRVGLREFGFLAAVIVGFAQAVAVMPGVSRSGATICAAILVGLHRKWAVEYSFLLALPAILGAALITFIKDWSELAAGHVATATLLAGALAAAIVGVIALKILLKAARKANLWVFAIYCYALAGFVAIYYLSKI